MQEILHIVETFIVEHWFDVAITVLFLILEVYNHIKAAKSEEEMNVKLKKLQNEIEFSNHLAYNIEAERYQDEPDWKSYEDI